MRVISGSARGLKLTAPAGLDTRPTLDRVKEALFNILASELRGARVLDLFAGSGALGIEALSRGGESAVFVDSSPAAREAILKNLTNSRLRDRAEIAASDALDYLRRCGKSFDLIFLDPPYSGGLYEEALSLIAREMLLSPGGAVVAEWDEAGGEPGFPPDFVREKDRHYGRVRITILRQRGEDCAG